MRIMENDKFVKITCEIFENDFSAEPLAFESWLNVVSEKLKAVGIPIDENGNLLKGTLRRFDDPKNFGKTIYEWKNYDVL